MSLAVRHILLTLLFLASAVSAATDAAVRVSIQAQADNELSGKLLSLLSKEVRQLEHVVITDDSPEYVLGCSVVTVDTGSTRAGYAASVAVTFGDGHLVGHWVVIDRSLEGLAHEVALAADGRAFESLRKLKLNPPKSK